MDLAALRAYAAAQQAAASAGAGGQEANGAGQAGAVDFGAMVADSLGRTESSLKAAETMTAQAAAGQAELVDVVTAVAAAEVQLETVVSVRDQVIRAYQEILQMPI